MESVRETIWIQQSDENRVEDTALKMQLAWTCVFIKGFLLWTLFALITSKHSFFFPLSNNL